jgi:putative membrane protein
MPLGADVFALIAAAAHVLFFVMESVLFDRPPVWKAFGVASAEDATVLKPVMLNQGFYNVFLAAGVAAGVGLHASGHTVAGRAAVVVGLGCMAGAGLVLLISSRGKLARGATIQATAPVIALLLIAFA